MGICSSDDNLDPPTVLRQPAESPPQTDLEFRTQAEQRAEEQYQKIHALIETARRKPHESWFIVRIGDLKMSRQVYDRVAKEYAKLGYRFVRTKSIGTLKFTKLSEENVQSLKTQGCEPSAPDEPPPYPGKEGGNQV